MRILSQRKRDKDGFRVARTVKSPLGDKNVIVIEFAMDSPYDRIKTQMEQALFINGRNSSVGLLQDYACEVVNGRNENVREALSCRFTLSNYIEEKKIPGAIRLYLLCIADDMPLDSEDEIDSDRDQYQPATPSGEVQVRVPRYRPLVSTPSGPPACYTLTQSTSGAGATSYDVQASCTRFDTQREYAELILYSDSEEELEAALQASLQEEPSDMSTESASVDSEPVRDIMSRVDTNKHPIFVNVVRGKVLNGARTAIKRFNFEADRPISVKFMDDQGQSEGAVDAGGPTREFFTLAMRELHDSQMFTGPSAKHMIPNQKAMENDMYFVAGTTIALSLANCGGEPRFFTSIMYQWMTKGYKFVRSAVTLDDVLSETEVYKQLHGLQHSTNLVEAHRALDQMLLELAGCTFPLVKLEDKSRIIKACVQFHLIDRTRSSMERFLDGLSSLGVLDSIRKNPYSFEPIFCEMGNDLCVEKMRDTFVPVLSPVGHNSRVQQLTTLTHWNDYLVDIREGQAKLQYADILMFATGMDTIPPCGFDPPVGLEFLTPSHECQLPTANTCSNLLRLPVIHDDYDEFKRKFELAISNAVGFGQP